MAFVEKKVAWSGFVELKEVELDEIIIINNTVVFKVLKLNIMIIVADNRTQETDEKTILPGCALAAIYSGKWQTGKKKSKALLIQLFDPIEKPSLMKVRMFIRKEKIEIGNGLLLKLAENFF